MSNRARQVSDVGTFSWMNCLSLRREMRQCEKFLSGEFVFLLFFYFDAWNQMGMRGREGEMISFASSSCRCTELVSNLNDSILLRECFSCEKKLFAVNEFMTCDNTDYFYVNKTRSKSGQWDANRWDARTVGPHEKKASNVTMISQPGAG